MMKLFYSPGSCSMAVHIALEEMGIPYERQLVSASDGSTKQPEYLAVNPKGKVPALRVNNETITELSAILLYLATSTKAIRHDLELVRIIEWMSWLSTAIHAVPIAQCWRTERFVDDKSLYAAVKAKGIKSLEEQFNEVEIKLSPPHDWALIDGFSVVDMTLCVFYRWGCRLGLDMSTLYPNWHKHAVKMSERPAVQRVLEIERVSLWS